MKSLALKFLRGYKRLISPMLPAACRYVPTCSEYAVEAVERFGIVRGGTMTLWRVLRCNPFVHGGVDPVGPSPAAKAAYSNGELYGRRERLPRPSAQQAGTAAPSN
jgi:putative membrane protein insertion efficiency factor